MITGFGVDERAIHPSRKLKRKIRAAIHQENREKAFGLLSWAECKEPKAFYTDRALLNKNIFHDDALDLSNDFFLSNLLSFETYVAKVENDFGNDTVVHEADREKWEKQKSAFLAQREAFYVKEKQQAEAQRKTTRTRLEKRFVVEAEAKVVKPTQQKKSTKSARANLGAATIETKEDEQVKELNINFDALKEIEQEQVASFQDEKRAKRRKSEEIKQKSDEQEAKKQLLNKLFTASIIPIVLMIGMMSYYFSATEVKIKESYPLIIKTVPYDAKIQIMNIIDKYTMGIELKPGEYDIRISKKGYKTQRFKIQMKHENIIIERELKKIKKRKVY